MLSILHKLNNNEDKLINNKNAYLLNYLSNKNLSNNLVSFENSDFFTSADVYSNKVVNHLSTNNECLSNEVTKDKELEKIDILLNMGKCLKIPENLIQDYRNLDNVNNESLRADKYNSGNCISIAVYV